MVLRLGICLVVAAMLILTGPAAMRIGGRIDPLVAIGGVVSVLIGCLVAAVILRAATEWVEKIDVNYAGRQSVVQTGRRSTNLGRQPDPGGRSH
jgi:hypothetical protein